MLTIVLILSVVSLAAYVAHLRAKGVEWAGVLCGFIGHTAPFQRAGRRHFECRRCMLAMGGAPLMSKPTAEPRPEPKRVGENWR